MKKRYIIIIIVFALLFLIGDYLGYKIYKTHFYNISNISNYEKYASGLNINDTITIKKQELTPDQYLVFNNIKIKNDFDDFEKLAEPHSTDEYIKYVLYDEDKEVKASFWIGSMDTYMTIFGSEILVFNNTKIGYEAVNIKSYFNKKDINNDIELIKYLVETKNKKNNIFTSIENMKSNYAIHFLSSSILINVESIDIIDGDYEGYILNYDMNSQKVKEVNILKNNKRYIFTIIGLDYFNDSYIKELLNTIVIDK